MGPIEFLSVVRTRPRSMEATDLSSPVEEQRADVRPDRGGVPARRAMARWAWRLFRREWRQQLLVLALITIAVMATILGAAIGTNTPPPGNETFGTAGYLATLPVDRLTR